MIPNRAFIVFALLPVCANAAIDLDKLQSLFDTGKCHEAYDYAQSDLASSEGKPEFDYIYGICAIDTGKAEEGVRVLQRVLHKDPEHHLARLELARAYFLLRQFTLARTEFETVLGADPSDNVRYNIRLFLDAIDRQQARYETLINANVYAGLGVDSNASLAPADATAYSQYQAYDPLTISSEYTAQNDSFSRFGFDLGISTPLNPELAAFGYVQSDFIRYSDYSAFDNENLRGGAGMAWLQGIDSYSAELSWQRYDLGNNDLHTQTGLHASWARQWSPRSSVELYARLASLAYPVESLRDARTTVLGVILNQRIDAALSPLLFIDLFLGRDRADNDSSIASEISSRDFYGLRAGSTLTTSRNTSLQLSLGWQDSEYGAADTALTTPILRQDGFLSGALEIYWRLDMHWLVIGNVYYTDNDSSIEANSYQRSQLGIRLQYRFF